MPSELRTSFALLIVSFLTLPLFAQNDITRGTLYGSILDEQGNGLAKAQVQAESSHVSPVVAMTSSSGLYYIRNLPPGEYEITVALEGYTPARKTGVRVSSGTDTKLYFVLKHAAANASVVQGNVLDQSGQLIAGATVTLESDNLPVLSKVSGDDGRFRFDRLPAGTYHVLVQKRGYLTTKPKEISVGADSTLDLKLTLEAKPPEALSKGTMLDSRNQGITWILNRELIDSVPNNNTIQGLLDLIPGTVRSDHGWYNTFNSPASEPSSSSGNFSSVEVRGAMTYDPLWYYNGVDIKVPDQVYEGAWPSVVDTEALQEIQVVTGANGVTRPTAGTSISLITKDGGRGWSGSASYYFSDHSLQSQNQPEGESPKARPSVRLEDLKDYGLDLGAPVVKDYGFEVGGPALKDRLFVWTAYRRELSKVVNPFDALIKNHGATWNAKIDFNPTTRQQIQFQYFKAEHLFQDFASQRTTVSVENSPQSILPGVASASYSWDISDDTLLDTRYGYVGVGFNQLYQYSGDFTPNSNFYLYQYQQSSHQITGELTHFEEKWLDSDQEFHFGFDYKTSRLQEQSSKGISPIYLYDYDYEAPAYTEGYIHMYYPDATTAERIQRMSLYASDKIHHKRLNVDAGIRFDRQVSKSLPTNFPSVLPQAVERVFLGPGFESLFPAIHYLGNDSSVSFDNFSPRVGATIDVTGDNKTLALFHFGRFADTYDASIAKYSNPAGEPLDIVFYYKNLNNDKLITPDEITSISVTDLSERLAAQLVDPHLTNGVVTELLAGLEREIRPNLAISVEYLHRSYAHFHQFLDFGLGPENWRPEGNIEVDTPLGHISVPFYQFDFDVSNRKNILRNINAYHRTYNGLEIAIRKGYSNRFLLMGGLVLQRQEADYNSPDAAGFDQKFDPSRIPFLNNRPYSPLAIDWQMKLTGFYRIPWKIDIGAFLRYQQGYPFNPNVDGPIEPIARRRYSNVFIMDLRITKRIIRPKLGNLSFLCDIFNLTNSSTVLRRDEDLGFLSFDEPFELNPTFGEAREFLPPRIFRLGIRYNF